MTMTSQVTYTQVKEHRNKPRLWLEGIRLDVAGFIKGAGYDTHINTDKQVIEFRLNKQGQKQVSGRKRNGSDNYCPIIDFNSGSLAEVFAERVKVRVVFFRGAIIVSLHHEERARLERERTLIDHLQRGGLLEASLFTGGGISTHAISSSVVRAGLQSHVRFVVDLEIKYLQVAAEHNPSLPASCRYIVGSAEEVEPEVLKPVDLLSFSMPCSPFSKAGISKNKIAPEQHEGGTALFGVLAAIKEVNPAILISENVTEARFSPAYLLLKAELVRRGYRIFERELNAEDSGSLENRARYWFIALSDGLSEGFDLSAMPKRERYYDSLADILIDDEQTASMWSDYEYLARKAKADAEQGKGFKRQLGSPDTEQVGCIGKGYNKRRSTEFFLEREDGKQRILCTREHAKAKGVPVELIHNVPETTGHEILGQSIDYIQCQMLTDWLMAHILQWVKEKSAVVKQVA